MWVCEDHELARLTAWAPQAAKLKEVCRWHSYLGRFAVGMTVLMLAHSDSYVLLNEEFQAYPSLPLTYTSIADRLAT
jgi:hypothetical protein